MESQSNTYYKFLEVKDSSLHGKGLFTTVDIPKGKVVMVIEGELISGDECERREEEGNVYIFWHGDNYIDTKNTQKIRYINHEVEANCIVEERDEISLFLYAEKDIKAGSELTIDYDYEEVSEFNINTLREI